MESQKASTTLLKTGIIGSIMTALCCFTPILVVTLGFLGLSAIVGYLDYILFPALGVFLVMTVYALMKTRGSRHEGERIRKL